MSIRTNLKTEEHVHGGAGAGAGAEVDGNGTELGQLKELEKYIQKYYPNVTGSHFTSLTDSIYIAALREGLVMPDVLKNLYHGMIDRDLFNKSNTGNIYNFIKNTKYIQFAKRIKDITVGSNGGMANVGKGEWLISLLCGINPETDKPYENLIKNGKGDIQYIIDNKELNEEVKWNGGKVSVGQAGKDVTRKFNSLIDIPDKKWVPFRTGKKDEYLTEEQREMCNAKYWQAISGEENDKLTNNELKQKIINMSFAKVFEKSDLFIMFNDDGKFQRFRNLEQANTYYCDKLEELKGSSKGFECRASQSNPIALYCHVF